MIRSYCEEHHSKNIMNITMIPFPSIFVHLEKAHVKNEIRSAIEEKQIFVKKDENKDNEEIQVHEPDLDVSFFFFRLVAVS